MRFNLHGVRHLTADDQGYVYWRGVEVEHYDPPATAAKYREAALEIERRCRHLESIDVEVTCSSAVWCWSWFRAMRKSHRYRTILREIPHVYLRGDEVLLFFRRRHLSYSVIDGTVTLMKGGDPRSSGDYEVLRAIGFEHPPRPVLRRTASDIGTLTWTVSHFAAFFKRHKVPPSLLDPGAAWSPTVNN